MSWKDALLDLFGYTPPEEPSPAPKPRQPAPAGRSTRPAGAAAPASDAPSAARPQPRAAALNRVSAIPVAPDARSEREVLRIVRDAGGGFELVVYTRNRRVMASVADRGATLRLNVAFATAPDAVLVAVAVLFSARDRRKRERAREAVRKFIHQIPHAPSPSLTRRRRVHLLDAPHVQRLKIEFDRVNDEMLGGSLPEVPIYLSGKMVRRNGHFSAHPLEIVISRRLCTHGEPGEAELTLRHEMVHLWQHATGRPVDHGLDFRRMARKLDVHPRATRPVKWKPRP